VENAGLLREHNMRTYWRVEKIVPTLEHLALSKLRAALRPSIYRAACAVLRSKASSKNGPEQSAEAAAQRLYGRDHGLDVMLRATSSPATLTGPGWAAELGRNVVYSQLIQKITTLSAAAALMEAGLKADLTGVGSITIPGRQYNPATAGAWVAEGQPIPVRAPVIIPGPKLEPRKLAVITAYTSEMIMADSIEEFVTQAIKEAAAALLDTAMFSANAADATNRPEF